MCLSCFSQSVCTCGSELVCTLGLQEREERQKWKRQQSMLKQASKKTLTRSMSNLAATLVRSEKPVEEDENEDEKYVHLRERIATIAVRRESG